MKKEYIFVLLCNTAEEEYNKVGIFTTFLKAKAAINSIRSDREYSIVQVPLNKQIRSIEGFEDRTQYEISKINCYGREITFKRPLNCASARAKTNIKQVYQVCYSPDCHDDSKKEIVYSFGFFRNNFRAKKCISKIPVMPEMYSLAKFPLNRILSDFKFGLCMEIPRSNISEEELYVIVRRIWK